MSRSRMMMRHTIVVPLVLLLFEWTAFQPVFAQQPASNFGLRIEVENGAGASTAVKLPSTEPTVVVVMDGSNRPVQGALVMFTAPEQGSGGVFENGTRTMTVTTDRNGRATAAGYRANATAGTYQIEVQAQFLNEVVFSTVAHTNVAGGKQTKKLFAILAIGGGGAAVVLLKAGGGGGGGPSTTVSFGGSSVGAPSQ